MRYFFITIFLFASSFCTLFAQEVVPQQDTIIVVRNPLIDSTFYKRDIFSILQQKGPYSNRVTVEQSDNLLAAFNNHILLASNKKLIGYRVRIFFDNNQSARTNSETVRRSFISNYPEVPAYVTYTTPYFRVTVGDFRTKSEAMMMLKKIEAQYPSAFLVRETINFPPL